MPLPEMFRRRVSLAHAYHEVFEGTPAGRMVLGDLLRAAGMLETSAVPGDSHMTHFREGRRSVGLHVLDRLRWREGELLKLAEEKTNDRLAAVGESG